MIEALIATLTGLFLVKIGFLTLSAILFIFLLVVLKQSYAMKAVIDDDGASSLVSGVALFNVFVGFLLFVSALLVL